MEEKDVANTVLSSVKQRQAEEKKEYRVRRNHNKM
jgi:hypothetical protein